MPAKRQDVNVTPGIGRLEMSAAAVEMKVRTKEPLRSMLEAAAARRGVSMNAEIVRRLEASFREEEQAGGSEMQELTRLWAAAFLRGGAIGARAVDHPEWTPSEWLRDPFAYRAAVHAGTDALLAAQPQGLKFKEGVPAADRAQAERFYDTLAQFEARNPGSLRVSRGRKK